MRVLALFFITVFFCQTASAIFPGLKQGLKRIVQRAQRHQPSELLEIDIVAKPLAEAARQYGDAVFEAVDDYAQEHTQDLERVIAQFPHIIDRLQEALIKMRKPIELLDKDDVVNGIPMSEYRAFVEQFEGYVESVQLRQLNNDSIVRFSIDDNPYAAIEFEELLAAQPEFLERYHWQPELEVGDRAKIKGLAVWSFPFQLSNQTDSFEMMAIETLEPPDRDHVLTALGLARNALVFVEDLTYRVQAAYSRGIVKALELEELLGEEFNAAFYQLYLRYLETHPRVRFVAADSDETFIEISRAASSSD